MKFIKGQLKDFWLYFKLYRRGQPASNSGKFRSEMYALITLIFALFIFYMQVSIGQNGFVINFFTAFLCGSAFGMGMVARIKPSILSVAPFSPKQRMVFSYLSAILYAIIISLIYIVAMIVFILLIALIAFLASGENIFVISEEGAESVFAVSKWSEMFYAFFELYLFFSVYAIMHIERQRNRNIALTVWFVVSEALMLVLVNAIYRAYCSNFHWNAGFVFFTEFATNIDYLANPWVPSLIIGILAVLAFIASIFVSYRRHRSLNF